jgi:hypothetical protein
MEANRTGCSRLLAVRDQILDEFFLGQTREVRRNYSLTYIHRPIHNMKVKKYTYLLRSEVKSRREDEGRRKEETRRTVCVEKLSPVQMRRIGCPSRLRRGLEDRIGVIYIVECGIDKETVVRNKDDSLKARRNETRTIRNNDTQTAKIRSISTIF